MIIQFLLSGGIFLCMAYFYLSRIRSRLAGIVIYCALSVGLLFVWQPLLANELAQSVGVGRGVDLIFYLWIVVSIAIFINLHLKERETMTKITDLVRALSVTQPMLPPVLEPKAGGSDPRAQA